jgi:nucleotide-binding universal stress UspA family protein
VQRLVVPLDGSELAEGALPLAVALARQQEIAISLVRAVDHASLLASLSDGTGLAFVPPGEVYQEMIESINSAARDYLASVAARVEKEGVKVTWAVWEGSPYVAITDATQRGDLIVLTSHGRGGALRWLMGSVAEKLVREASVPVLLVPSINRGSSGSVSVNR